MTTHNNLEAPEIFTEPPPFEEDPFTPADMMANAGQGTAAAAPAAVSIAELTPAARVAALTAIRDAIDVRMKLEKEQIIENLQGATKDQTIPTPFGKLSFRPSREKVEVDEEKLLAFVKENHPGAITTRTVEEIDPDVREDIIASIVDVGDGLFVDGSTGVQIDFAYLGNPTTATISYPASQEQKIVKAQARKALSDQFAALTYSLSEAVKALTA